MRFLFITIIIFIFAVFTYAQQKCELTLEQSPRLLNLKLGITPNQASSVLPIKVKAKTEGQRTFFKNYIKKDAKGSLAGIRALFLRFYDGKLYQIEVFYKKEYRWQTLENFLSEYSSNQNFPQEFWKTEYGYSKANCNGFSLDADFILNPHIQITNDEIAKIVESKQKKLF